MGPSNHDVVGPPGELLDVGTVVGQSHGAAVEADVAVQNVRNRLEVLERKQMCLIFVPILCLLTSVCGEGGETLINGLPVTTLDSNGSTVVKLKL